MVTRVSAISLINFKYVPSVGRKDCIDARRGLDFGRKMCAVIVIFVDRVSNEVKSDIVLEGVA